MATLTLAEAPFTRKRVGAHYVWAKELEIALAFANANGLSMHLTDAPYQVAKLCAPDVTLVLYPHKTKGTGHISLRVRNENSRNKSRALELMYALDATVPFENTFSVHFTSANSLRAAR